METNDLLTQNKISIMKAINAIITKKGLKQREVATILDIKQPRVSNLAQEKSDTFSLDILMKYLGVLGSNIVIDYDVNSRNNFKFKVIKS